MPSKTVWTLEKRTRPNNGSTRIRVEVYQRGGNLLFTESLSQDQVAPFFRRLLTKYTISHREQIIEL